MCEVYIRYSDKIPQEKGYCLSRAEKKSYDLGFFDGCEQTIASVIDDLTDFLKHESTTIQENGYTYHGYTDESLDAIAEYFKSNIYKLEKNMNHYDMKLYIELIEKEMPLIQLFEGTTKSMQDAIIKILEVVQKEKTE